jgi:hypothetical protein
VEVDDPELEAPVGRGAGFTVSTVEHANPMMQAGIASAARTVSFRITLET